MRFGFGRGEHFSDMRVFPLRAAALRTTSSAGDIVSAATSDLFTLRQIGPGAQTECCAVSTPALGPHTLFVYTVSAGADLQVVLQPWRRSASEIALKRSWVLTSL